MSFIYICSPFRATSEKRLELNKKVAKVICKAAVRMGHVPIAPHLYFPEFLDDNKPAEREMGIRAGKSLLLICKEIWVSQRELTEGMRAEVELASKMGIKIVYLFRKGG